MSLLRSIIARRLWPGRLARAAAAAALAAGLLAAPAAVSAEKTAAEKPSPAPGAQPPARSDDKPSRRTGNRANLLGHGGPVRAIGLNADGTRALTGSFDYSMIYWDLSGPDPKILRRFEEHDAAVNAVRFLADGKRALSAGDDGIVRLWELESGKLLHRFEGHTARVVDLALSPDGKLAASASWDRTTRLWDLEKLAPGPVLNGHTGPVNAAVFTHRDGKPAAFYTASYDGTVRLWDHTTGELKRIVYNHGWGINCLQAIPDPSKLVFGSLNGAAGLIDVEKGEVSTVFNPHEGPVLAIAVSAEHGLIATGGGDGTIHVWTTDPVGMKEQYQNPYGPIWGLAFAADGKKLYYSGLDDFVTQWQISPRQPFETVESRFPRRFQVTENMSLGEQQFARKCSICHTIARDGGNRAGPTLFGVFGRKAGTVPDYPYSPALKNSDIVWNEETIGQLFDHGPQHVTPGSKMPLQQIEDAEKRNALIAYLKAATSGETDKPSDRDAEKSKE